MKLTMKREALEKLNRLVNDLAKQDQPRSQGFWNSLAQEAREWILEWAEML